MDKEIVYLVEEVTPRGKNSLEPISIQTDLEKAKALLNGKEGIVTEIIVDEVYPDGIGVCDHWHIPEK